MAWPDNWRPDGLADGGRNWRRMGEFAHIYQRLVLLVQLLVGAKGDRVALAVKEADWDAGVWVELDFPLGSGGTVEAVRDGGKPRLTGIHAKGRAGAAFRLQKENAGDEKEDGRWLETGRTAR